MHFDGNPRAHPEGSVGWALALLAFACSEGAGTPPAVTSGGGGSGAPTLVATTSGSDGALVATTSGTGGGATGPGAGGMGGANVDATGGAGPTGQAGSGFPAEGGFDGTPATEAGVAPADGQSPITTRKWHPTALTFDGPTSSEMATPNPFRDFRMIVTFEKGARRIDAQGYFAADGNAAETGASAGNKWRAHFVPSEEGTWSYKVSFRSGTNIATSPDAAAGMPASPDGQTGSILVLPTDKTGADFRGKGSLRYVEQHHLQFDDGSRFLKGGADSPETFLAFADFDQTKPSHHYAPHAADWKNGDPVWQTGKGKGIIGALNYLSGKGMNSVYFLTMNVNGDGNDVWPWTSEAERYRFDCSKLDQWEIVFSHMDRMGLMLHVVMQETENDQLLDGGALGPERTLYYRELVARFSHHLAITWNLGEENTNSTAELKSFAGYLHSLDPYRHPVVVHTFPGAYENVYRPLVGYPQFDGASLQMVGGTHAETQKWVGASKLGNHPWVVSLDEIGPAGTGVLPDADDPTHDKVRKDDLWGNLMAGGAGSEWYFGYSYPNNDLNCEDWRSRDKMWDQTRVALDFFRALPVGEMASCDALVGSSGDWCFGKSGTVYAVYLPTGATTTLNLAGAAGTYSVQWYDPMLGGNMLTGSAATVIGPTVVSLGAPPRASARGDWAVLIKSR